jgi:hypothetical protein
MLLGSPKIRPRWAEPMMLMKALPVAFSALMMVPGSGVALSRKVAPERTVQRCLRCERVHPDAGGGLQPQRGAVGGPEVVVERRGAGVARGVPAHAAASALGCTASRSARGTKAPVASWTSTCSQSASRACKSRIEIEISAECRRGLTETPSSVVGSGQRLAADWGVVEGEPESVGTLGWRARDRSVTLDTGMARRLAGSAREKNASAATSDAG